MKFAKNVDIFTEFRVHIPNERFQRIAYAPALTCVKWTLRAARKLMDMSEVDVDDLTHEKECLFEGEHYSVRDNGAVLRHPSLYGRARSTDNKWTFGRTNSSNPYLHISGVRVHRIVATAFHGEAPDEKYIVDHIDSNCRNNRPENLRWLTRLENTLKNPITRKKIEYLCGSIEAFLKNPSMLNDLRSDPNFSWMRTVTREEAQNAKKRMDLWASEEPARNKPSSNITYRESYTARAFKPLQKWEAALSGEPGLDFALTPWCAQYMWGPEVHFPCCPQNGNHNSLSDYYENIGIGELFAYNDEDLFPKLRVCRKELISEYPTIVVMCDRNDQGWSVVGIILNERSHFIHFHLGSFTIMKDAEKVFHNNKSPNDFWSNGYGRKWDFK